MRKNTKLIKTCLKKIKRQSKKSYFSKRINDSNGDARRIWNVMKEIIGRAKVKSNELPKQLIRENNIISDKGKIAESFNDFYVSVGRNLASKIPISDKNFADYLSKCETFMPTEDISLTELRTAFKTLSSNKSPGLDEINTYIIKSAYDIIEPILLHIFNLSVSTGEFPDSLKIAKVTPIYKSGDQSEIGNYRPISVLSGFSKILERIMYNRLYKHLMNQNILYKKQFGFLKNHSTEHAILELVSRITDSFEKNMFTLGVFIDLSKAFDTVDHNILISKLENYGIQETNLKWFKDYLTNRKQCIIYDGTKTKSNLVTCGVPQGSILGPLLFLIYINDLHKTSSLMEFILFADDTNIFYSDTNIERLFQRVNDELDRINEWFIANKLSLNIKKTKYILFSKRSKIDEIPLRLPSLKLNEIDIERVNDINFLGVILDQTLNWKRHIETVENKISKNIGILFKAKPFLELKQLKQLYFSFINCYLDYCNIAWGSTSKTSLKKLFSKQKHALRIIFGQHRQTSVQHRFQEIGALNIYQLNMFKISTFMFKVRNKLNPTLFETQFHPIQHKYPTRYSCNGYQHPKTILKCNNFSIRTRGPLVWNTFLTQNLKSQKALSSFRVLLKQLLFVSTLDLHKYF